MIIKFKQDYYFTYGGKITVGNLYKIQNTITCFVAVYVGINDDLGKRVGFQLYDHKGNLNSCVEIVSNE